MSDFISDVGKKLKEAAGGIDNLTQFRKKTKLQANYVENEKFSDSNSRIFFRTSFSSR